MGHAPIGLGAFWNMSAEVALMMRPGWPADGTPSVESLRELRLRALLNDLVKDMGPGKLAEQFGVDRKTLWRWQQAAELPPRLAEALERMLLERAVAALEADRKRVGALEERVGELERQLAAVNDVVRNGAHVDNAVTDALRQEFARELQRLERQLGRPAPAQGGGNAPGSGSQTPRAGFQRRHPDVVTRDTAHDDEQVYGAAWPLVEEWRELWEGHPPQGRGLAWTARRERILELEIAMLDEHGLTLPPETAPLGGLDRREQWSWRERELERVRRRRARLELLQWARRVLTLGRWRR